MFSHLLLVFYFHFGKLETNVYYIIILYFSDEWYVRRHEQWKLENQCGVCRISSNYRKSNLSPGSQKVYLK